MQILKKIIIGLGIAAFVVMMPVAPAFAATSSATSTTTVVADAFSGAQGAACQGVNLGSSSACPDETNNLTGVIKNIVTWLSIFVGVVAVIMLIVGGLKYVTSGGESSKTASAKNTILFALIGVAIAALAQALVHFVLHTVG